MTEETLHDPFAEVETPEEAHGQALDSERWVDPVDTKAAEKTKRDSQLPGGMYQTVPELRLSKTVRDGRRFANFFGHVIGVGRSNEGEEGRVSFRISPDRVDTENGKPDRASQLWADAVLAYRRAFDQDPTDKEVVLEYIQKYPVRLRGFPGMQDFVVTNISEVRE